MKSKNMREIKFRAWNTETKQMFMDNRSYSLLLDTEWSLWDTFGRSIEVAKKSSNGLKVNYKNGILMQYTGRKDKKGKEIYKGDIMAGKVEGYEIYEVKIEFNSFRGWYKFEEDEVIGNIYENPDLLVPAKK